MSLERVLEWLLQRRQLARMKDEARALQANLKAEKIRLEEVKAKRQLLVDRHGDDCGVGAYQEHQQARVDRARKKMFDQAAEASALQKKIAEGVPTGWVSLALGIVLIGVAPAWLNSALDLAERLHLGALVMGGQETVRGVAEGIVVWLGDTLGSWLTPRAPTRP